MTRKLGILTIAFAMVVGVSTLGARDAAAGIGFSWGFDGGDHGWVIEYDHDDGWGHGHGNDYDFDDYDYGFNPDYYSHWEFQRRMSSFSNGYQYGHLSHGEYAWLKNRERQRLWHWNHY